MSHVLDVVTTLQRREDTASAEEGDGLDDNANDDRGEDDNNLDCTPMMNMMVNLK